MPCYDMVEHAFLAAEMGIRQDWLLVTKPIVEMLIGGGGGGGKS